MWEKFKSWKRWGTILGIILPLLTEAVTGKVGWKEAAAMSIVSLLMGLHVIGKEDIAKIEAGK